MTAARPGLTSLHCIAALLLAISVAGSSAAARQASSGDSLLDLHGSRRECRRRASELMADEPARWREAQFRLAMAGPAALDGIDQPRLLADERWRPRVAGVLRMGLLLGVPWRDLEAHPRLVRLVADSLARAYPLASRLSRSDVLPGPDARGPQPIFEEMPASRMFADDSLRSLGGYAVPAVLAMLHDSSAVGRAYGCVLLQNLRAEVAAESLKTLFDDGHGVVVDHWDYDSRTTVGRVARTSYASLTGRSERPSDRFEKPLTLDGMDPDLVNGIRQASHAMQARTWDEWWDEARPVWRDWWRLCGTASRPPDREAWLNAVHEYSGFRLFRPPNPEPRTVLEVIGPRGTMCTVETDSMIVASGEPPLTVIREQDSLSVARRLERDRRGDFSHRTFYVRATLPDGRTFSQGFFWSPSTRLTVELLPALKPRR